MEEKPNYYAVIPSKIRYDEELIPNEKLLYGEITALTNNNGECWATNRYFANLYEVHINTVSNWIQHLKNKEYIEVKFLYKEGTKSIEKRIIKINGEPINKKIKTYQQNYGEGINEKVERGINENIEDNNTSINNTRIIKEEVKEEKNLFEFIELEFGRTLSPSEYEVISDWEDTELTRYAIKQAILNGAPRIKYIQAILDSYKSKNIKSVQEAQKNEEKFKKKKEGIIPEWFGKEIKMEEDKDAEEFAERVRKYHQQHKKS